ncbi:MAG: sulfite exporter TauE/SafE family protein [Ruminococcaceae bacterium]|nr:sulfite exporter TauE/SafE family protein [Oscillospiraceae bacterium]
MQFVIFLIIGFAAQLIDGTLGMAYGVSCRTFLKMAGLPASMASAVVHCAEVPTSLVSGLSHWRMKNVSWKLFLKLAIPGVAGGILGAWVLTSVGDALEPFIDLYLIVMGVLIFIKVFKKDKKPPRKAGAYVYPLGFAGGFLDATGGGGWGPVVSSTMLASNHDTKKTIGTVNMAEFVVTLAQTTTFLVLISDFLAHWQVIVGLILGGVLAAPLAAYICKKLPVRPLLAIVGTLIVGLNVYNLVSWLVTNLG